VSAIELNGVTKQYGSVAALRGLDLTVEAGEVFGFLGPNGAGKSTTIDIVLDHTRPTAGEPRVLGMDPRAEPVAVRERTGVLPEEFGPLGDMTGREHVAFAIEAKGATGEPEEVLDRVGVGHAADRPVEAYSKGMTQRLMLGMAIAGEPDLLILDEPTSGLDPNGAREIRRIVTEEAARGATVFFSSHVLEQVEAVCDRVGILDRGRLVAVDTIDGLREATGATGEIAVTLDAIPGSLVETVSNLAGVSTVVTEESTLIATCTNDAKARIVRACHDAGVTVSNIETGEASLEDLFAAYTGGV
jgi:ABC-2 type transport system ATP-binding protein